MYLTEKEAGFEPKKYIRQKYHQAFLKIQVKRHLKDLHNY